MGLFTDIKSALLGTNKENKMPNLDEYLTNARASLKQASDSLSNFLSGIKNFRPARRHEQLFSESIYSRASLVKAWTVRGITFLDERLNNTINTANYIKSAEQLSSMINDWVKVIRIEQIQTPSIPDNAQKDFMVYTNLKYNDQENEEKLPEDILGILKVELWSDKRLSRGFPAPDNKELLLSNLENAYSKLKETQGYLLDYNAQNINVN